MQIFVKKTEGNTTTLNVESNERIFTIKRKLKEKEGMRSDLQHLGLIYNGKLLDDGHTLAHYDISKESTLCLFLSRDSLVEPWILNVETWSKKKFALNVSSVDTIDDVKAKIQVQQGIPPHKQLLFNLGDTFLEDGSRTLADYGIHTYHTLKLAIQLEQAAASEVGPLQAKRARPETPTKATSISDTICQMEAEFKENKEELTIARNKEKELEAIISGLKAETKKNEEIARNKEKELETTISRLKAENNKTKKELTLARNKEKKLEATVSELKAGNKKTEEELKITRNKEKELEATISALTHKIKVFYDECASYDTQVNVLQVENKKIKEELMNADKKYYAGARAAGYAEGLEEGKAKRLKFLHRLNDASMQYFNHGFNSCQKQAEEQGFCGQLNKDSALKNAPDLKGWESSDQPH